MNLIKELERVVIDNKNEYHFHLKHTNEYSKGYGEGLYDAIKRCIEMAKKEKKEKEEIFNKIIYIIDNSVSVIKEHQEKDISLKNMVDLTGFISILDTIKKEVNEIKGS